MYLVVSRIDNIMNMTIANLILQVALGVLIYIICIIVLRAPIVNQVKKILKERRTDGREN